MNIFNYQLYFNTLVNYSLFLTKKLNHLFKMYKLQIIKFFLKTIILGLCYCIL